MGATLLYGGEDWRGGEIKINTLSCFPLVRGEEEDFIVKIIVQTAKNNLFDLPKEFSSLESSRVIVIPSGFEKSVSFGRGTKNGPEAIISASRQVELFDEELWQETHKKVGIATLKAMPAGSFLSLKKQIGAVLREILPTKKLPIVLGGEHSITPFIIGAFKKRGFDDFSILQFDAHADLRDGYMGQKYSHAAAMRRSLDFDGVNLVQVGIRNISNENDELKFWKVNQARPVRGAASNGARIKTFWAKDKAKWELTEILENLNDSVYLSFDVDVFDSSIMPSTGTPEPGGLEWQEALDILRAVCAKKKIIGADFVELAPIRNFHAPDFMVAKLIYKFIGYTFNK